MSQDKAYAQFTTSQLYLLSSVNFCYCGNCDSDSSQATSISLQYLRTVAEHLWELILLPEKFNTSVHSDMIASKNTLPHCSFLPFFLP